MKLIHNRSILYIIVILTVLICPRIEARNTKNIDSTFIKSVLPNGLTYYIKNLPEAGDKISMQFLLNAGSRVEEDDQQDISHVIEHLAFRTTKNFPQGISNNSELLKSMGMFGVGIDILAFNGSAGTIYIFNANNHYSQSIDTGLLWFGDILGGLALTETDIDIERKEIIQERLGKTGANRKDVNAPDYELHNKLFPCSKNQKGYVKKIQNFTSERLRAYYKDWYQPKNAAILIAGNIPDIHELEAKIKKNFAEFENSENAKPLRNCDREFYKRPNQFISVERSSNNLSALNDEEVGLRLFYRDSLMKSTTGLEGFKRQILWEITLNTLHNFIEKQTQSYSTDFEVNLINTFKYRREIPPARLFSIDADSSSLLKSVSEVYSLISEIKKFGLTASEWEKLKNSKLKSIQGVAEFKHTNPRFWLEDFKSNFWYGETLSGTKYQELKQWLEGIDVDEMNQVINKYLEQLPEDIGLIIPENSTFKISESQIRKLIRNSLKRPVSKSSFSTPNSLLTAQQESGLTPGSFTKIVTKNDTIQEFNLENGIQVILIEDPNADKISIRGFQKKGFMDMDQIDKYSISNAPAIIKHAGMGQFDKFQIDRFLDSMNVNLHFVPYIKSNESGLKGHSEVKDFEYLLQMIHLYFSEPRYDVNAFKHWKKRQHQNYLRVGAESRDVNNAVDHFFGKPKAGFHDGTFHYQGTQKASLSGAHEAFNTIFSDFSDFKFIIYGPIEKERVLPVISIYLGNIKSQNNLISKVPQSNVLEPQETGPKKISLESPENYKKDFITYSIRYIERDHYNWKKMLMIQLFSQVLFEASMKMSGKNGFAAYTVSVGGKYNWDLSQYEINLMFNAFPEDLEKIKVASHKLFNTIKNRNLNQDSFDVAFKQFLYLYGINGVKYDNEYNYYLHYRYGIPLVEICEKEKFLNSLTKKDFEEFVAGYLDDKNLFEFEMKD
ncbi:insulinase family protein [Salegentibacter sp. HM20]